jgi:hypothetical protein
MDTYLEKTKRLLDEALNNDDFHDKYSDKVIGIGERSVDYMLYQFDLSESRILLIDFTDYAFESFSVVNKDHIPTILTLIEEE